MARRAAANPQRGTLIPLAFILIDMRRWLAIAFVLIPVAFASAQTRKPVRQPAPPPPPALEKIAPDMSCPTPLGVGLKTKRLFCDVMTGRDPAEGVLIKIPPHQGP